MNKNLSLIITLFAVTSLLFACVGSSPNAPEKISDGNTNYMTGFYGSLFPEEFEYSGESVEIKNTTLNRIKHERFALYHADVGSYTTGTIYCAEKDYKNAQEYYSNPENYSYHCVLGVDLDKTIEIDDVDKSQFSDLVAFAENNAYDPFDKKHNSKINTTTLPMPDHNGKIVLYKKSLDGLFTSTTGNEYYIIDNCLYLVYRYDYGHGEYKQLIAVKVPDEISAYFTEYLKSLL